MARESGAVRFLVGMIAVLLGSTLLVLTIVVLGAVVSAGIFAVQTVTGTAQVGTITDVSETTVRSRRGFSGSYCSGYLQLQDGRSPVRVRVYSDEPCSLAVGQPATLVPGVLAPVTSLWASEDLDDPMPLMGALGAADGALLGSAWNLLTQNGVFAIVGVLVLGITAVFIRAWRGGARLWRRR